MKVALVKVPPTYSTWHHRPALGLSYLACVLEKNGIDVKIFDAHFNRWTTKQLITNLFSYKPTLIGITAMTHEIKPAAEIVSVVKENLECKAVVGGPHITALPLRTLREFPVFDYGIQGEGEKTLPNLVGKIVNENGKQLLSLDGLVFRSKHGEICCNKPASFLTSEELNSLPYPSFHQYFGSNSQALSKKNDEYAIVSSRGCHYNCAFCMRVLGNNVRWRSPENIVEEIKFAVSQYGAHTIDFVDEIFLTDTPRTRQILQTIIDEGLNRRIRWSGLTRANLVTQDIIALAKESGCKRIEMGVESGNDEVLKRISKAITTQQVKKAVDIIKNQGIYLVTYYILGHPGETKETIDDTIRFSAELNTDHIAVGLMVPYPGTRIYEYALSGQMGYKLLTEDWNQYDKYGGNALELTGLPHDELIRMQKKMYLNLYLKNHRVKDLFKFSWKRRSAFIYFLKRWMPYQSKAR